MLWRVTFTGSYWDNDPRMPGSCPVEETVFVFAKGLEEAKKKAEPFFARARKDNTSEAEVEAHIATIEAFVPTERREPSGGGVLARTRHWPIKLSDPEDAKRYRLAVCLVPVEES